MLLGVTTSLIQEVAELPIITFLLNFEVMSGLGAFMMTMLTTQST